MRYFLNNGQMRGADAKTIASGVSGETLMARAGKALAEEVIAAAGGLLTKKILIVCGLGNNGGDGYVCARELLSRGASVKVYAVQGKLSPDCAREKTRYEGVYTDKISGEIIVDCLFGTGLCRPVEGALAQVINQINSSGATVVSADIPSGINGDNGRVEGVAVKADITVAFAYPKYGCVLGDGIDYSGKTVVKDIGIKAEPAVCAPDEEDIARYFPARKRNTHKGSYGSACVVAGSQKYCGAAALSVAAALKSGCGYVYAAVDEDIKRALFPVYPQAIYCAQPNLSADCIAFGMGRGNGEKTYAEICSLLQNYGGKLVLDADALNALSSYGTGVLKSAACKVLITPHMGEFARLTGMSVEEIAENPVEAAQNFAREYNVVVHLKSAVSLTCDGERCSLSLRGDSSLAKAGSGDMLAGLICGSAARGLDLYDAAVCSQYILGGAAEACSEKLSEYCVTARDVLKNIPIFVKRLTCL